MEVPWKLGAAKNATWPQLDRPKISRSYLPHAFMQCCCYCYCVSRKRAARLHISCSRRHRRHNPHRHRRRRRHRRCHRRHRLHCRRRRQRDGSADERLRLHDFFSAGQLGSQFFKGLNAWRPARRAAPLAPAQDLFNLGRGCSPPTPTRQKTLPRIIRPARVQACWRSRCSSPRATAAGYAPSESRPCCRAACLY